MPLPQDLMLCSLRCTPRSSADDLPPAKYICKQLRELGLWAACRFFCSRPAGLCLVRRRGQRAGRHVQQERVCLHPLFITENSHSPTPFVVPVGVHAVDHSSRMPKCSIDAEQV